MISLIELRIQTRADADVSAQKAAVAAAKDTLRAAKAARAWPIVLQRMLAKIEQGPVSDYRPDLGPCWLWMGALSSGRYGECHLDGQTYYVHRAFYTKLVGPIPEGLEIDHLCRVLRCCNPAHLEPVTKQVNQKRKQQAHHKSKS